MDWFSTSSNNIDFSDSLTLGRL